jgi:hypothetical protein
MFVDSIGTQRRKKKHVNVQNVNEDKKLKSAIKKFGKGLVGCLTLCRSAATARYRGGEYVQG